MAPEDHAMTDTFDAVLAEMRAESRFSDGRLVHDAATGGQLESWADRLAAAHAAEVAKRDARIAALEADKKAMFIRAREWATRSGEQEQRAEAAERDARRLDWLLRNGKEIVFFV